MFMPRAKIVEAAAVLSPASFSKPRRVATSIPLVQSCDFHGSAEPCLRRRGTLGDLIQGPFL